MNSKLSVEKKTGAAPIVMLVHVRLSSCEYGRRPNSLGVFLWD